MEKSNKKFACDDAGKLLIRILKINGMLRQAKPKIRHWTQTPSHNFFSIGITKVVYPLMWRLPTKKVCLLLLLLLVLRGIW
jgi:hypothetical protein